jgi:hypothetical protein
LGDLSTGHFWPVAPVVEQTLKPRKLHNPASTTPTSRNLTRTKEIMAKPFTTALLAVTTAFWVSAAIADKHGHAHPLFAPDINAFHSLLAPIWRARPGKALAEYERNRPVAVDG